MGNRPPPRRNTFRLGARTTGPLPPVMRIDPHPPSTKVRAKLREDGRPTLLAFSGGKDSVAAWLALRDDDVEVIPFYMYLVPGLEFVDAGLAQYEEFFGVRIRRIPHPSLYRWLNNLVFQPPERCAIIEAAGLPEPDYPELQELLMTDLGLPLDTWVADGVRAADSPNRRTAFKAHGPWRKTGNKVSPVWDWKIAHLRDAILRHNAPLPQEYEWFGRSFDGLDYRFLSQLRRHAPADYQRILDWFPLADLELFRAQRL